MRGKSLALLVLALGCGLVASLGITQVLAKRGNPRDDDFAQVFVAKVDLSTGATLSDDNLKPEQWPKDKVPAGALVRKEDVTDRRVKIKVVAGQVIMEPMLMGRNEVLTDTLIAKGLRAVAVPVSAEAIHSGLVLPGSRCDVQVFIRADPALGIGETICKTILQDIRVLAVNDVTSTESHDPKTPETKSIPLGKTVSLLVTPAQAEIVTLASQLGTIRLVLRSSDDNEEAKTKPVSARELVGAAGSGNREKENPLDANEQRFKEWANVIRDTLKSNAKTPAENPSGPPEQFTMRVRTGADVTDVLLVGGAPVQGLPDQDGRWTATNLPTRTRPADKEEAKPAATVPPADPTSSPGRAAKPAVNTSPLVPKPAGSQRTS